MRAKFLLIGVLGLLIVGAVLVSPAGLKIVPPPREISAIQAATNVVFTHFKERFVVSDDKQVREISSTIRLLEPKGAVGDLHYYQAIFRGPSGEVSAHFCPRCFTVRSENGGEYNYAMPNAFYATFQTLARQHGWKLEEK